MERLLNGEGQTSILMYAAADYLKCRIKKIVLVQHALINIAGEHPACAALTLAIELQLQFTVK
jgi:hypothetical protein